MAITGWSGLWNNEGGSMYSTRASRRVLRAIRQATRGKSGRRQRELMIELSGTAPGATALRTNAQVKAEHDGVKAGDLGGKRTIQTVNLVNRATTAADATAIDTKLDLPPDMPAHDLSGNGGGGKLGY